MLIHACMRCLHICMSLSKHHGGTCETAVGTIPTIPSVTVYFNVYVQFHMCWTTACLFTPVEHVLSKLVGHREFYHVNVKISDCRHSSARPDSHNKPPRPRWWKRCLVSEGSSMYLCVHTRSALVFPQGRISLTNVSERKDKMRLGMTLTSNPKDNSFVVRKVGFYLLEKSHSVIVSSCRTLCLGSCLIKYHWLERTKGQSHNIFLLITQFSCSGSPFSGVINSQIHSEVVNAACINVFLYVTGLWATVVLWVWQLVLQHWHLLQSQR